MAIDQSLRLANELRALQLGLRYFVAQFPDEGAAAARTMREMAATHLKAPRPSEEEVHQAEAYLDMAQVLGG